MDEKNCVLPVFSRFYISGSSTCTALQAASVGVRTPSTLALRRVNAFSVFLKKRQKSVLPQVGEHQRAAQWHRELYVLQAAEGTNLALSVSFSSPASQPRD